MMLNVQSHMIIDTLSFFKESLNHWLNKRSL